MKNLILLLFVALFVVRCSNSVNNNVAENTLVSDSVIVEPSNTNTDFELTCAGAGKILLTSSVAEIESIVGKQNLHYDSVFTEGEFATMQLIAFKDKPEELIFFSQEENMPFKNISAIKIQQQKSPYAFTNGIKIGTKIDDLEKLNGNIPISFSGFGWDYEGGFFSFNKGTLEKELPCFGGRFYFTDQNQTSVLGDSEYKSNNPEVKKIGVYISEIIIANRH